MSVNQNPLNNQESLKRSNLSGSQHDRPGSSLTGFGTVGGEHAINTARIAIDLSVPNVNMKGPGHQV